MNGRMASLKDRRWFNPTLPQMLQIAVFLLYFGAFFGLFDALDALSGAPALMLVIVWASVPLHVLGGLGVSEERKRGYQLAIAAAAYPFLFRLLIVLEVFGEPHPLSLASTSPVRYVITSGSILNFAFEAALVVLLLHTKSKEHVRIWFR